MLAQAFFVLVCVFLRDGRSFTSGGEDGYVRIHHFDPEYFSLEG
jgi:hypothetical protein